MKKPGMSKSYKVAYKTAFSKSGSSKKKIIKKKKQKLTILKKVEIDQILFNERVLFIYDTIDSKMAKEIVGQMIALSALDNKKAIVLRIDSGGGSIMSGLSIINTMQYIKAPVITCITGLAASMAGLISISGNARVMNRNAIWMAHEAHTGYHADYFTKEKARIKFLEQQEYTITELLKKRTKLSVEDLLKAKNEELWLTSEEALKKGIVDNLI